MLIGFLLLLLLLINVARTDTYLVNIFCVSGETTSNAVMLLLFAFLQFCLPELLCNYWLTPSLRKYPWKTSEGLEKVPQKSQNFVGLKEWESCMYRGQLRKTLRFETRRMRKCLA